ncbi:hypothetical protein KP509_34G011000 [Ceratopteris richardii]|uniref:Uncharacterized protein n=1 Tax=Ceratopteris richardii TaxID=49495 RepID=A0A8T2QI00_CERRI|nr:hypothetical protein KP509_34G011000 [Ceratopteris richardii]
MANFTQSTSIEAAAMEQGVPDRETFRRFRKRRSSTGMPSISGIEDDFDSLQNSLSTRKVVEAVKEEHSPEGDKGLSAIAGELHKATGSPHIPLKSLHDDQRLSTPAKGASPSFKVKQEPEEISDSGESSFSRFAFILQSALQGALPFPELILRFEACCKDLAEHVRSLPTMEVTVWPWVDC